MARAGSWGDDTPLRMLVSGSGTEHDQAERLTDTEMGHRSNFGLELL